MRDFDPCASEFIISGYLANSKPGRLLYDPVSILTAVAPSVIGGIMGGDSAGKAADAQAQSGRESDATQRYFYDTTRADNAPMRQTGLAANNRLAMLMGLNPGNAGVNGGQRLTREGLQNSLRGQYTNTTTTGTSGGYESNYTGGNEGDGYIQPQQIQTSTVNQQGLDGEVQRQLDQRSGRAHV